MKIGMAVFGFMVVVLGHQLANASAFVYVSEKFNSTTARVVVVIHGCRQTPEAMALGTGWNQIADRENLVVIYPQVPTGTHQSDCWSWFLPENQQPKSGQLATLRGEINSWKSRLKISKAQTFVTGLSSGAATAAGLLVCFPKDFAAGAVHSGPSYGLASNLEEAEKVLKEGPAPEASPKKRACNPSLFNKPVLVIQGTADPVVNPLNVDKIVSDYFGKAARGTPVTQEANKLSYTTEDYKIGTQLRGRVVKVNGLGHAWAGYAENLRHSAVLGPAGQFPTKVPFFSDQGPSSTNLIYEFFKEVSAK